MSSQISSNVPEEESSLRIFTQGCFIRQQSGYLISTRTLKKL